MASCEHTACRLYKVSKEIWRLLEKSSLEIAILASHTSGVEQGREKKMIVSATKTGDMPQPPEGYRILLAECLDLDSGEMSRNIFAVNATISFQLRWDEYWKDGDTTGNPSGALLASYEPGTDPIKFGWNDDIRDPIRLPPGSQTWNGANWVSYDSL